MRKIFLNILFFACLLVFMQEYEVFAASTCATYFDSCGVPELYQVTMNKLRISTTGSSKNAITIVSSPQSFNIASVNAGAVVGSWFSGTSIPPGKYNWMERTISGTFVFKGYVNHTDGFTYYTSSLSVVGPNVNRIATASFDPNNPPADYASVSTDICNSQGVSCTNGSIIEEQTDQEIPIEPGKETKIKIIFNVNNTLGLRWDAGLSAWILSLDAPSVNVQITEE